MFDKYEVFCIGYVLGVITMLIIALRALQAKGKYGDVTWNHPEFQIMGSLCSNRGFRILAGWDVIGAV